MLPFRYLDVAIQIIFSLVTASAANMSACLASGSISLDLPWPWVWPHLTEKDPIFRCEVGDAEMKMNSDNKNYTLKHIPNVSGHPTIDISSSNPSSITGDSFTVVLPSCCMLPYNCNDVIYDVKGTFYFSKQLDLRIMQLDSYSIIVDFRKINRRCQSKYNTKMDRRWLSWMYIWLQA